MDQYLEQLRVAVSFREWKILSRFWRPVQKSMQKPDVNYRDVPTQGDRPSLHFPLNLVSSRNLASSCHQHSQSSLSIFKCSVRWKWSPYVLRQHGQLIRAQ